MRSFVDVRLARAAGRAPATLPFLSLEITLRCNARCGICGYVSDYPRRGRELSSADLFRLVDEARELGTRVISLGGGEPFLRPDVMDLIRHVAASGIVPFVHTNGSLLDRERLEALAATPSLVLALSLDSHRRALHDAVRGLACFDSLVAGARFLARAGRSVIFTFTISGLNYGDLLPAAHLAYDVGVRTIRYTPFHENLQHRYRARAALAPFRLRPEHAPVVRDQLEQVMAFTRRHGMLTNTEGFLRSIPSYIQGPVPYRCYAGFLFCSVDPFGIVVPCYDHAAAINVRDHGLRAAFQSPEMNRLRREVVACRNQCWDMGHVEPSLRADVGYLLRHVPHLVRETVFFLS